MIDATFEQSTDENIFGTLIDDRGTFEFNRNPETGNLARVDADNDTIILPTDGQDLRIERDDGSSIEIRPEGASDVLVVLRNDPTAGSVDLQVDRMSLGDLEPLVRPNEDAARFAEQLATCEDNEAFVDTACEVINNADLNEAAMLIADDLASQMENAPPQVVVLAILSRSLEPAVRCCLAWEEFRASGSACP